MAKNTDFSLLGYGIPSTVNNVLSCLIFNKNLQKCNYPMLVLNSDTFRSITIAGAFRISGLDHGRLCIRWEKRGIKMASSIWTSGFSPLLEGLVHSIKAG